MTEENAPIAFAAGATLPDAQDAPSVNPQAAEPHAADVVSILPFPCDEPSAARPETTAVSEQAPDEFAAASASADLRRQLVSRFEAWLDEALSDESPPQGLDAEILAQLQGDEGPQTSAGLPQVDQYSLWSAMVSLAGEIKLQGRAFKQVSESLAPVQDLADKLGPVLEAHREAIEAARAIAQDARSLRQDRDEQIMRTAHEAACREFLDLLLDVCGRLDRGLASAGAHLEAARAQAAAGWFARLRGRGEQARGLAEAAEALVKGNELSLDQLRESLDRLGVHPIECQGEAFDPERMKAVDVAEASDAPEGTVLAVYRAGYEWQGHVYRLAEVKVARGERTT